MLLSFYFYFNILLNFFLSCKITKYSNMLQSKDAKKIKEISHQ